MSWLARSITNSLLQYDVISYKQKTHLPDDHVVNNSNNDGRDEYDQGRGEVKKPLQPSISMKRDGLLLLIEEAGLGNFGGDSDDGKLINRSVEEDLGNVRDDSDDFGGEGEMENRSLINEVDEEGSGKFCDNSDDFGGEGEMVNRSLNNKADEEGLGNFCDNSDDFVDGKMMNRSLINEAGEEGSGNFCDNSDDFGDGKMMNRSLINEADEEGSGNVCDDSDDFGGEGEMVNRSLVNEADEEASGNFCDNRDDFVDGKMVNKSLINEADEEGSRKFCDNSDDFGDGRMVNRNLIDEAVIEEDLGRSYCKKDDFDDGQFFNRSLMKDEEVKEEDLGSCYHNGDESDDGQLVHWSEMKDEEVKEEDLGSCYDNGDEFDYAVEGAVGVTEEALAFAHNIAHHPETWLDFPVEEEDEEGFIDFQISDSQYKHALAIERCVPTLAALRIELCPVHMSEGYFWMVYFVLLHSRLCKNDADQLSSDELVLARSTWREELKKRANPETDWFARSIFNLQESTLSPRGDFDPELLEDSDTRHLTVRTYYTGSRTHHARTYSETEKQIVECYEDKSADTPGNSERDLPTFQSAQIIQDDDDDGEDDWLQDTADLDGYSASGIVVDEEDVSFSDLEEGSDWTMPIKSK